jgi:hypothetical protein
MALDLSVDPLALVYEQVTAQQKKTPYCFQHLCADRLMPRRLS